jgi:hypothetical protein
MGTALRGGSRGAIRRGSHVHNSGSDDTGEELPLHVDTFSLSYEYQPPIGSAHEVFDRRRVAHTTV